MKAFSQLQSFNRRPYRLAIAAGVTAIALVVDSLTSGLSVGNGIAEAQTPQTTGQALTLRSDIQEANAKTGVITARGNVQIFYPARQIQATAAQAQYFSRERRIVLSGNVYVWQQGNSMRGETVTYLIDEGRFVALPRTPKQVESIYLVPETTPTTATASPQTATPFGAQSELSSPTQKMPAQKTPAKKP
jgi:lipopolysaccharide export system protein LptA